MAKPGTTVDPTPETPPTPVAQVGGVYQGTDSVVDVDPSESTVAVRYQTPETRGSGKTKIASRPGHAFRSADLDFDVTSDGVYVTAEQAKAVIEEANGAYGAEGYVFVVNEDDEG